MNPNDQQAPDPMRFHFERLGPIEKAELDLGNLTVIAGRNNTGKTYIAYAIYGFLKHFQRTSWRQLSRHVDCLDYAEWIESVGMAAHGTELCIQEREISLEEIKKHRCNLLSAYSDMFSNSLLAEVFSSRRGDFDGASVSIELSDFRLDTENVEQINSDSNHELLIEYDGRILRIASEISPQGQPLMEYFLDQYRHFLVPELSANISIISAERFGISLFYRELDFTKNQLVEMLQKLRDENYSSDDILYLIADRMSSRYALPIKDNIHFTRSIAQIKGDEGTLGDEKLFEHIERLLNGCYTALDDEVRFKSKSFEELQGREIGFDIPLYRASSSARGLSDLYFFLKHQVGHNDLLVIDEPESHLDTANQVQLARILARFVRAGVRVLITTHSDYLLKEFNNLIMLSSDFRNKEKVRKSLGYFEEDFLAPSLIRAYIAEEGGLSPCDIDAFGIDLPPFDQVINSINRASNELATRIED